MNAKRRALTGIVVVGCLVTVATEVAAGKPVKPPPSPCTDCSIAYVASFDSTNRALMLIKEDGTGVTELYREPNVEVAEPAWSPDGQWIAFSSRDNTTGELWLNVIRPDGTGLTRIAPRCSFDGRATRGRVNGPSWQPVDHDGNGLYWLVYNDGRFPDETCNPDRLPLYLWAVEVGFQGSEVTVGRRVQLSPPDAFAGWTGYPGVWLGDGFHLAAVQWPEPEYDLREVIVYDVVFTDDGVPQLANPWSATPAPSSLLGSVGDLTGATTSNALIVSVFDLATSTRDLWRCDVDPVGQACIGGWMNLTPSNDDFLENTCLSGDDTRAVLNLVPSGKPAVPARGLYAGAVESLEPFDLQLLVPATNKMTPIYPDWRP